MFFRIVNYLKLIVSYRLSIVLNRSMHWGYPSGISIEPTNSCNLSCPECPSGQHILSRESGKIKKELFEGTMDQVSKYLFSVMLYFQGEPYLHKSLFEMIRYSKSKKVYTIVSTNAHFIDDENARETVLSGLDKLIISIDGSTQETYESYRVNGQLEKVLEGVRFLQKWKKELKSKTPAIYFQFLVTSKNEHEIGEIYKLAKKYDVEKVRLKTIQIYDYEIGNELIPKQERYSRYKKVGERYKIKNKLSNSCWRMWANTVVTWNGELVPCCFDKDATIGLGDLRRETFKEIWEGELYNNFRKQLLTNRKGIPICKNCTEGTKVWI